MINYEVIKTMIRTEKGTALETDRKYLFRVSKAANKKQIEKAVESIYKVKVESVNTVVVPGKRKRVRRDFGHTSDWKKAIVTLQEGHKIEVA